MSSSKKKRGSRRFKSMIARKARKKTSKVIEDSTKRYKLHWKVDRLGKLKEDKGLIEYKEQLEEIE